MKKFILLASIGAGLVAFLSLNSCRHEFSGDRCADNPIRLSLVKIDAAPAENNGTIMATASGGEGFKFSLNGAPFQDSGYFAGLQPFLTYNVVVKNSWGCTDTAQAAIGISDPCSGITVTVTATKTDASPGLNNGTITATATGGTGFTYSINGGVFQPSGTFSSLAIGNYTVTAKNADGCTGTTQVTIVTNDPCAGVTVVVSTTQVNPTGTSANGSITASATGGTGFMYKLNSGAFQTSGTFTGLVTGNYTITAKNSNGCLGTATVALGATNPCAGVTVTVTLTKTDPTTGLSNGSITATATGATGFTYSLNGGAYQTSGTFTGLVAGSYTVTAKSSAGCLGSAQITLVAASACAAINITVTSVIVNNTPCVTPAVGKITVTATGSTGFTYNINGGAYQASNIFSALAAGNYTVGVKDANGCTKTAAAVVANAASGPLFAQMRTLISTRCNGSGCHMNGANAAGYNFDNDCSIVAKWSQINQSCVTYTMARMPKSPQPFFTAAEKQKVTDWINAGHRYTD
jgi:hypothetical protein